MLDPATIARKPATILADLTASESGSLESNAEIFVRPYPFPFAAGLALSNDCDSQSLESFEDWHAFVNGSGPTPYGQGLGLEVGDSFWIWGGLTGGLMLHAHFPDEPPVQTPYVGRLVELAKAGWFDTLHSLGNWKQDYKGFRYDLGKRENVTYAVEILAKLGLSPRVFVNHSYSPSNVSGPWGNYQKIDDPAHSMYGLDLLKSFGFKYFWYDAAQEKKKFGDQLRFPSDDALRTALTAAPFWPLLYKRLEDGSSVAMDFPTEPSELRDFLISVFNRTIVPTRARDGTPLLTFKRFRGELPAYQSNFHHQASPEHLDQLEEQGGAVVIYQHFGVTENLRDGAPVKERSKPPVLSPESVAAWRDIAHRVEAGRLWVATVGRFLDYIWMAERLKFTVSKGDEKWIVSLRGIDGEPGATFDQPYLDGLSFVVPQNAPAISIVDAAGKERAFQRSADPLRPGRDCIYAPWRKLEWPDDGSRAAPA